MGRSDSSDGQCLQTSNEACFLSAAVYHYITTYDIIIDVFVYMLVKDKLIRFETKSFNSKGKD